MTWMFFSDTNLDGFVQSISHWGLFLDVDPITREVTVTPVSDKVGDLADQWGGVLVR